MRILFDTNIILDIALGREPHFTNSADAFKKIDNKAIFGFIITRNQKDFIKSDIKAITPKEFLELR
jgi:hypothetical protein